MTDLADAVLSLIRTRADLSRWSAANEHGRQMHEAVDILEAAIPATGATESYTVTHKALASAVRVIARADDSSGIIGDACMRLLDLHRAKLDEIRSGLRPVPAESQRWLGPDSHARWALERNDQRLAVLDRDIDAIIRTHARDRKVAAWLEDTARAFEEVGEIDLAIDWAKQATDFDQGHQSRSAAEYWCELLAEHRTAELVGARLEVFRRWPSSSSAAYLYQDAGESWPDYRDEVLETLAASPRDAVLFALLTLKNVPFAWNLAHSLGLDSDDVWERLAKAYGTVDPLAVLPVLRQLVENELTQTGAQHYRIAARRLVRMRRLAAGSDKSAEVVELIADLRETHRRRPRLQQEFDYAGLP